MSEGELGLILNNVPNWYRAKHSIEPICQPGSVFFFLQVTLGKGARGVKMVERPQ
jgi:hypothetical protein